jgi:RNA polymerase sigma-70 factor (ECF subfamily)
MKSIPLNDGDDASPRIKVLPIMGKHCATMVPLQQHVAMVRDPQRQPDHVPEAEYEAGMDRASADHPDKAKRFRDAALPHLDAVYTLARYLLREPADAEDAVQECYLRALRHFDTLRNSDVKPWLFAILRNVCRVEYARRSRVVLYDVNAELNKSEEAEPLWSEAPETPETTMVRKLDAATIQRLVAALPDPFREVIVLREINDLSYRDIAEVVGVPVGTVMSRLARARSILRTAWLAEGQLT